MTRRKKDFQEALYVKIFMIHKRAILQLLAIALLGLLLFTQLVNNTLMLLMDRSNFIPAEASIFSLEPYLINEGSSAYWLYAEDSINYYHFTYEHGRKYVIMNKSLNCPNFNKNDVRTWCHAVHKLSTLRSRHSIESDNF